MGEVTQFWTVEGFFADVWVPCLVVGSLLPAFGSLIAAAIRAAMRSLGLQDSE